MKFATSTLTALLLILIPCTLIFSQRYEMEAGLVLGGANYGGDLVQPDLFTLKETKPMYGFFFRYPINPQWGIRANMMHGKISGDDQNYLSPSWRQQRAFNFKTNLTELGLLIEWNPLEKRRFAPNSSFNKKVSPYLFTGIAGVFFDPQTNFSENKLDQLTAAIEVDQSSQFPNAQLTIPMGMGVKVNVSDRLVVGVEGGVRPGFTDYLDGVSQSGNAADNDWYGFAGATVSFRMVERDTDHDGIADSRDRCPEIPGAAKHAGCPDSDGDGVVDAKDHCPLIPGKSRLKGCPDTDKDGIADQEDACPDEAGLKEYNGCPALDTDQDGIVDAEDTCPDVAGLKTMNGCPDTDMDGVPDHEDKCPTFAGNKTTGGCPKTAENDLPAKDALKNQIVFFETNRSFLTQEATSTLNAIVQMLENHPEHKLYISGFTDAIGDETNNLELSEERAKACFYYLASHGVPMDRMAIVGLGETHPVATNDSPIGRQLNRRAEFKFFKAGEY